MQREHTGVVGAGAFFGEEAGATDFAGQWFEMLQRGEGTGFGGVGCRGAIFLPVCPHSRRAALQWGRAKRLSPPLDLLREVLEQSRLTGGRRSGEFVEMSGGRSAEF
jgi:hypothetical protein